MDRDEDNLPEIPGNLVSQPELKRVLGHEQSRGHGRGKGSQSDD